jgi:hypothetical protein
VVMLPMTPTCSTKAMVGRWGCFFGHQSFASTCLDRLHPRGSQLYHDVPAADGHTQAAIPCCAHEGAQLVLQQQALPAWLSAKRAPAGVTGASQRDVGTL